MKSSEPTPTDATWPPKKRSADEDDDGRTAIALEFEEVVNALLKTPPPKKKD